MHACTHARTPYPHPEYQSTWFFPGCIGPRWPGGPPNGLGPNPGTERKETWDEKIRRLQDGTATWATSYIDHLTLTDEWGGAHVWWARFGGSWKVFHRFFETLHLVLHTGLKEANTQTLEWPATKFKFCHVWEFNLVPSMKERGCLTVMFDEVQMLTRVCGSRDGCVKWT